MDFKQLAAALGPVFAEIGRSLEPLRTRISTLSVRAGVLERRVLELGGNKGMHYRGVWRPDNDYQRGDTSTYSGSLWHCNGSTTAKPGSGATWTLCTKQGSQGPKGDRGPRPEHEWRDTELRFERADGSWGEYVDLKGPSGRSGALTAMGLPMSGSGGGSTSTTTSAGSWFPAGWN